MHRFYCLTLLIFSLALLTACSNSQETEQEPPEQKSTQQAEPAEEKEDREQEPEVVAMVGDTPIHASDLPDTQPETIQTAVVNEILYMEGKKKGLDETLKEGYDPRQEKVLIANAMRTQITMNNNKEDKKPITDEDIEEYYQRHIEKYSTMTLGEITVKDRDLAEEMLLRLQKGQHIASIKEKFSDNENVSVRAFRENKEPKYRKLVEMEKGYISDIVQEDGEYRIYQVLEVDSYPMDKLRTPIRYNIEAERKWQKVLDFVEKAKKENNIEVKILKEQES